MDTSDAPQNNKYIDNKLRLVPFAKQYFPILASWFLNESDIVQWGGTALSYPLDEAQFNLMLVDAKMIQPGRLCWMIEDDSGNVCGHCQLFFDWRNGNATLCRVVISPQFRGKGLARPMVRLALEKAFSYSNIERVELNVYVWNTVAIKTYTHIGFIREGVRRSSAKVGDERWDTAIMSMLRDEWINSSN